jgi:hypothetical protein
MYRQTQLLYCVYVPSNTTENKQNRRYKQINFIGLQNNHLPSQHTVSKIDKASGNCQQRSLYESIAEPLSHVLGLPPRGGAF